MLDPGLSDTGGSAVVADWQEIRLAVFGQQLPYGRPSPQVVQLAEVMQSYISLLVDQYQAGSTLPLIGLHGLGYWAVVGRCVDGYRKTQAVLVHEGFKRYRPHCGVMPEQRMQAYYSYILGRKRGM